MENNGTNSASYPELIFFTFPNLSSHLKEAVFFKGLVMAITPGNYPQAPIQVASTAIFQRLTDEEQNISLEDLDYMAIEDTPQFVQDNIINKLDPDYNVLSVLFN